MLPQSDSCPARVNRSFSAEHLDSIHVHSEQTAGGGVDVKRGLSEANLHLKGIDTAEAPGVWTTEGTNFHSEMTDSSGSGDDESGNSSDGGGGMEELEPEGEEIFLPHFFHDILSKGIFQDSGGRNTRKKGTDDMENAMRNISGVRSQHAKGAEGDRVCDEERGQGGGIGARSEIEDWSGPYQRMVPVGLDHGKILFQPETSLNDTENGTNGRHELVPLQRAFRLILDAFVQVWTHI